MIISKTFQIGHLIIPNYYSNDRLFQDINDNNNRNIKRGFINRNETDKFHNLSSKMSYLNQQTANNNMNIQSLRKPKY